MADIVTKPELRAKHGINLIGDGDDESLVGSAYSIINTKDMISLILLASIWILCMVSIFIAIKVALRKGKSNAKKYE